jgi:phosphatidylglycerophosphate synthase
MAKNLSIAEIFKKRRLKYSEEQDKLVYFLRYLSWPLTIIFYYLGFTANLVTLTGTFFIFLPAYFISLGGKLNSIIGSVLFLVWFLFDLADGEVARCRQQTSLKGLYLDFLYHDLAMPVIYFALGMNAYHFFNSIGLIYLGFITAAFAFLITLLKLDKYRVLIWVRQVKKKEIKLPPKTDYKTFKRKSLPEEIINLVNHPHKMAIYFIILSIFNWLHYAIFFYAAFTLLILIPKLIIEYRSGLKEFNLK